MFDQFVFISDHQVIMLKLTL